jgi:thiol-disulfide isomerase/thioredoxin
MLAVVCNSALVRAALAKAPLDLHALIGRVVYLDFWASWCTPCRQSFPWMQALQDSYRRSGLTVVAVNLDHESSDAERFLQQYPVNFRVVLDPDGDLAERFRVVGMPSSRLIDRHGVVRFTHIGFQIQEQVLYEQQIRQLLAEK